MNLTLTPSDLKELTNAIDKLTMKVDTVADRLTALYFTHWGIWVGSVTLVLMVLNKAGII